MKKIIQLALAFILYITPGLCDSKSLIEDLGNRAIKTLTNSSDSNDTIEENFLKLFDEGFDVRNIASFVMGRYWKQASPAEQDRFVKIFKNRVKKAYASRFKEYKGVKFHIVKVVVRHGSDYVDSTIQKPNGPKTDVEWRVKNGKIQDVKVEGVSMGVTMRDDYNSLLGQKNGNIEAFLKELEGR
ncbi:MAG: ABC transporter substrate-binding protein [Candidatus Paracaedibacteraceae bacterium]|nr:ABC transporter substrate-binding protein [Candidatus Paracaedibacteraceae bacterium]